jgi:hypothetical protein
MGSLRRFIEDLINPRPQYGIQSVTQTGEYVRSKAEQRIADYLTSLGIVYQYEKTAKSNDFIFKEKISKPDFYLPQYDVWIEYWGLLNAKDKRTSRSYEKSMRYKMARYHQNNIKFISLYPSNLADLDYNFRKKFREAKGFDLPTKTSNVGQSMFCPNCRNPIQPNSRYCQKCGNRIL